MHAMTQVSKTAWSSICSIVNLSVLCKHGHGCAQHTFHAFWFIRSKQAVFPTELLAEDRDQCVRTRLEWIWWVCGFTDKRSLYTVVIVGRVWRPVVMLLGSLWSGKTCPSSGEVPRACFVKTLLWLRCVLLCEDVWTFSRQNDSKHHKPTY